MDMLATLYRLAILDLMLEPSLASGGYWWVKAEIDKGLEGVGVEYITDSDYPPVVDLEDEYQLRAMMS